LSGLSISAGRTIRDAMATGALASSAGGCFFDEQETRKNAVKKMAIGNEKIAKRFKG